MLKPSPALQRFYLCVNGEPVVALRYDDLEDLGKLLVDTAKLMLESEFHAVSLGLYTANTLSIVRQSS